MTLQFLFQRAASLDEQRSIDRLVGDLEVGLFSKLRLERPRYSAAETIPASACWQRSSVTHRSSQEGTSWADRLDPMRSRRPRPLDSALRRRSWLFHGLLSWVPFPCDRQSIALNNRRLTHEIFLRVPSRVSPIGDRSRAAGAIPPRSRRTPKIEPPPFLSARAISLSDSSCFQRLHSSAFSFGDNPGRPS